MCWLQAYRSHKKVHLYNYNQKGEDIAYSRFSMALQEFFAQTFFVKKHIINVKTH